MQCPSAASEAQGLTAHTWLIIGRQWLPTQCNMQDGVRLVKSMRISYTDWSCSTLELLHGHLKFGNRCH